MVTCSICAAGAPCPIHRNGPTPMENIDYTASCGHPAVYNSRANSGAGIQVGDVLRCPVCHQIGTVVALSAGPVKPHLRLHYTPYRNQPTARYPWWVERLDSLNPGSCKTTILWATSVEALRAARVVWWGLSF